MNKEKIIRKTKALIAVAHTSEDLREAAKTWLASAREGSKKKEAAAKAYVAALECGIATIDETIALFEKMGAAGKETLAQMKEAKKEGAVFCPCEACTLAREILQNKELLA